MPVDLAEVDTLANEVLRPGLFFSTIPLVWKHHPAETTRWEVFQGRLLDPAHTREEATFESWNIHEETEAGLSPEPILSLKLDAAKGVLHVVRGIENHVQEAYSEGNVIQTREARRWVRELIASFNLSQFDSSAILRDEVALALLRAVTGTRLPLMPIEAPMPAFSFGRLFYFPGSRYSNNESPTRVIDPGWLLPAIENRWIPRLLEIWLRVPPTAAQMEQWQDHLADPLVDFFRTLRLMVNDLSLSPWTDFVDRLLRMLREMPFADPSMILDFESYLLRLVCRHLTAYDLVTFHHRGANYPDALLLESVLNDYLARLNTHPHLFEGDEGRIRRRALRQAYLLRRLYENHPVPDVPTSPGEHLRVLPEGHPRVPEEQILNPAARRRRLYENDPLLARLSPAALALLRQSVADLSHADERQELGAAVYLDRPFGDAKAPVEPDATPLVASLAYSRFIAAQRLAMLRRDLGIAEGDALDLVLPGLTLDRIGQPSRPGTVSLTDAARAAPDFVYRYTLPGSVRELREWIDFGTFTEQMSGQVLIARSPDEPNLIVYDETYQPILQIVPRHERGYVSRRGIEYPAAGVEIRGV